MKNDMLSVSKAVSVNQICKENYLPPSVVIIAIEVEEVAAWSFPTEPGGDWGEPSNVSSGFDILAPSALEKCDTISIK